MLDKVPSEMQVEVLLRVVRNLIVNSRNADIFMLREILMEKGVVLDDSAKELSREELHERVKQEVREKLDRPVREVKKISLSELRREPEFRMRPPVRRKKVSRASPSVGRKVLTVPRTSFPQHLQNLKPVASDKRIDLGKLNPLVGDSNVSTIETDGENEKVFVTGKMGRKPTNIVLSKSEIEGVIDRFSQEGKIPKSQGLFKVAVGKLLLTAMVSSSVSSRFVIEKMSGPAKVSASSPYPQVPRI